MSLEIHHLTKVYGAQKAVDDISFSLSKGEIVGFLGPNGAGKSTTMKVATGYISPTEGTVYVGGFDVREKPQEVKRITGYLPEHNPLYLDLFVHEYLLFVGRLYGLRGKSLTQRVNEMVELCGLTREQGKKIEALSKGYRQRVGLAQALIHNPDVLILDEPTSGLDPNQILEIRKLIKDISLNKTVLFSSHIMQEVQALCNRVVVINRGVIVANDQLSNVMQMQKGVVIIVEFERAIVSDDLLKIRGVKEVQDAGNNTYRIGGDDGTDLRPEIFRFAADNNLSLVGLRQEENSLENIFRDLTIASPQ
jgi:ABC-2 type transport system ATP-binding protein